MNNSAYKYDDIPYETLDGKVFYMSPRPVTNHNRVTHNLSWIFETYLRGKSCMAFSDGEELHLSEKDTVIPDFMIVCNRNIVENDGIYGVPNLIIEVLSPSTARNDKGYKKELYRKFGVKEYWIINIDSRSVEVYLLHNGQYELMDVYSIYPDYILKKMTDEEKNKIVSQFKTSLFDDLIISVYDIFYNLI